MGRDSWGCAQPELRLAGRNRIARQSAWRTADGVARRMCSASVVNSE